MREGTILLAALGTTVAAASIASASVTAQVEVIAHDTTTGIELGRHTWSVEFTPGTSGSDSWGVPDGENPSPWDLGGAKVHGISFAWLHDPMVTSNFNVSSGPANMTFTVSSTLLAFSTITPATGQASAAVGVTDSATFGDVGSVSFVGLQPGAKAFSARYNGPIAGPNSTFLDLITGGTVGVAPGGSTTFLGQNPSFPGYDPVAGSASDMHSQFKFSLSRFDRAVGTSTYEIIPAPGAAAMLGLGGLLAARRRRAIVRS